MLPYSLGAPRNDLLPFRHAAPVPTPVTIFLDESGPTDRYVVIGMVVVADFAAPLLTRHLDNQARQIESTWPKLTAMPEWKGSILGRKPTRSRRAKIRAGEEPPREARAPIFARGLASVQRVPGVWALGLAYEWTSPVTLGRRGADYRLRRATLLALAALDASAADVVVTSAVADRGHDAGYSAAFGEYFSQFGGTQISPSFVDSATDRRVQLADLVATAAKQRLFPSSQFIPGSDLWLQGLTGSRLLVDGLNPVHHRVEL